MNTGDQSACQSVCNTQAKTLNLFQISIKIKNVKNIQNANLAFPFSKGLYAIVGENGCGKSTVMLAMSLMVKTSSAHMAIKRNNLIWHEKGNLP